MKLPAFASALGFLLLAMLPVHAQSVSFDTEKLGFKADVPEKWCVLESENARDAFFKEYLQKAAGKSLRIHAVAMPCAHLSDYRKQGSHLPEQFLALSQVGVDGSYVRFLLGKGVYARLISSFDPEKGIAKIEKRTADKLKDYGDEVSNMDARILGADKRGNIWMQGALDIKEQSQDQKNLQIVGASNLVEKYPFAVFYASTESESDLKYGMNAVSLVIGSIGSR